MFQRDMTVGYVSFSYSNPTVPSSPFAPTLASQARLIETESTLPRLLFLYYRTEAV